MGAVLSTVTGQFAVSGTVVAALAIIVAAGAYVYTAIGAPSAGERGPVGPTGPAGPVGPQGPAGVPQLITWAPLDMVFVGGVGTKPCTAVVSGWFDSSTGMGEIVMQGVIALEAAETAQFTYMELPTEITDVASPRLYPVLWRRTGSLVGSVPNISRTHSPIMAYKRNDTQLALVVMDEPGVTGNQYFSITYGLQPAP